MRVDIYKLARTLTERNAPRVAQQCTATAAVKNGRTEWGNLHNAAPLSARVVAYNNVAVRGYARILCIRRKR